MRCGVVQVSVYARIRATETDKRNTKHAAKEKT